MRGRSGMRLAQLKEQGVATRTEVVEIVKELVTAANAVKWGRFEFEETNGAARHKVEKLRIGELVPGVELLNPTASAATTG